MQISDFSFSTSWNWRNSRDGQVLMQEIMGLGFTQAELNYKIGTDTLQGILPLLEEGQLKISSIHNVFPETRDARFDTDSPLLGYEDPQLRQMSVDLAIRSVDAAGNLGARAVVIHPGEAALGCEQDEKLKKMYNAAGPDSHFYTQARDEVLYRRKVSAREVLPRMADSLYQIGKYAQENWPGLKIAVENRAMIHQMPDFREAAWLMDQLQGLPVGVWLDTGHAAMMHNMGAFDAHRDLALIERHVVGMHIHDAVGVDDHFAPYEKTTMLDFWLPLIRKTPVRVLELGAKNTPEMIRRGTQRLLDRLNGGGAG